MSPYEHNVNEFRWQRRESEQPMLNTNYSEQDWESAMRYGEEHAAEFAEYGVGVRKLNLRPIEAAPPTTRDLASQLFDDAVALARTRAAELRGGGR